MSDTPRTDALFSRTGHHKWSTEWKKHASQLERELVESLKAAEHAKAYKRTLKEDNAKLRRELAKAAQERDSLAEALSFYADVSKYPSPLTGGMGSLYFDCGDIARAALAAVKGEEP